MPCRDDRDYDDLHQAKKQLNDLTIELCETRKLLFELIKLLNDNNIKYDNTDEIKKHMSLHLHHRLQDKNRAERTLQDKLTNIEFNIKQIIYLGGIPSEELLNKKVEATNNLKEVQIADPMNTNLF